MTVELHDRLMRGHPPFAEVTIASAEEVPIAALQRSLAVIVAVLRAGDAQALHYLHDWHEHDGYLTSARPVAWDTVAAWIASPAALVAVSPGDYLVALAVYPEDYRFYLRFGVYEEDEVSDAAAASGGGPFGWFDVSVADYMADAVARTLDGVVDVLSVPTAEFFAERYGG
jgi:hypothetical protein